MIVEPMPAIRVMTLRGRDFLFAVAGNRSVRFDCDTKQGDYDTRCNSAAGSLACHGVFRYATLSRPTPKIFFRARRAMLIESH